MQTEQTWLIAHQHGTTAVRVGDRVRFADAPDEEWEVAGQPDGEVESDYGDGSCPTFPCRQMSGDTGKYPADRRPDGTISMCGDAIAEDVWRQSHGGPDAH